MERFKGRPDKLIYRSVKIDLKRNPELRDLNLDDNYSKMQIIKDDNSTKARQVPIMKMTQKFELNPLLPAETQIRKTEFNLTKGLVYVYYHFREGRVTSNEECYKREDLLGQAKMGDMNEKDTEENKTQQLHKRIDEMERKCHEQIKDHERNAKNELDSRVQMEKTI